MIPAMLHLVPAQGGSTPDPDTVTPGVVGFLAILFLAVATILLVLDMLRRVRRTRYRGEVREQLERERAASREPQEPHDSAKSDDGSNAD
ncbi:hypothetical protein ACFFGH_31180 [Lysobacter korlensis]|uniref:Uncharacterized protein n=1 Tax=Lysobacter korlensis TaxID=553636 RepID=A0ABV6RZA8_9GAMM